MFTNMTEFVRAYRQGCRFLYASFGFDFSKPAIFYKTRGPITIRKLVQNIGISHETHKIVMIMQQPNAGRTWERSPRLIEINAENNFEINNYRRNYSDRRISYLFEHFNRKIDANTWRRQEETIIWVVAQRNEHMKEVPPWRTQPQPEPYVRYQPYTLRSSTSYSSISLIPYDRNKVPVYKGFQPGKWPRKLSEIQDKNGYYIYDMRTKYANKVEEVKAQRRKRLVDNYPFDGIIEKFEAEYMAAKNEVAYCILSADNYAVLSLASTALGYISSANNAINTFKSQVQNKVFKDMDEAKRRRSDVENKIASMKRSVANMHSTMY